MQNPLPPFLHGLGALSRILDKAAAHCAQRRIAAATILQDRLFPDMLPFVLQVQIACDTAKGLGARLAGIENPRFADDEADFDQLKARISRTAEFLSAIPDEAFAGAETRDIVLKFGEREVPFVGAQYLDYYARPNFYFHLTTAYNILRHDGIEIGKSDFLGSSGPG